MDKTSHNVPRYQDTAVSVKERAKDLVSRMTLEEKISQMVYDAPAIERLGIPKYNWWNECLHGVGRAGIATVFPQAIGLAATWNTDLMYQIATAISDEARAKHHQAIRSGIREIYTGLTFWSPNINIFRDPRWGRGQETYGECPYLTARMGVAFVKGLQGSDPHYLKLVATPKHYAVHSGPELDRHHFDARVGERDLRETYLPAFKACVKEANAYSVMGAYNRTNGEPCCAHPRLLEQILRQEWGFQGYVVSDCGAIQDIYAHHQVVGTPEEAAALAVQNGCELNCGEVYPALRGAVEQGLIAEETIDRAVERLFEARFRLGMFDPPAQVPFAQIPIQGNDSPEHRRLAARAARESIVLLKNENGFLPLKRDIASIAVIGPNADSLEALLGNYNGTPSQATTILEGIRVKLAPHAKLYYARGCEMAEGIPLLSVVPPDSLRPSGADAGQSGLTAAYYDNPRFEGEPVLVRVDPQVDFAWKGSGPLADSALEAFSVRWTGDLVAPASGAYALGVKGFSGYRLCLDGQEIVQYQGVHHAITQTVNVELEAGCLHRLELEYVNRGLDPQVQLLWARPDVDYRGQALQAARKAQVVVMVMGLSPSLEGEEMPIHVAGFAGGDRTDIELPHSQASLLEEIHALGKPVVLVLLNGSALAVNWAQEHVPAILEAWYPGQDGGNAVADVLFGDYNPGGRLPVTFYRSIDDLPPFTDYNMEGKTYRYFRGRALYPFGFGLSYTKFTYRGLQITPAKVQGNTPVQVAVQVCNIGRRAGDEVVQVYVTDLEASVPVPIRQLVTMRRLHLAPGETEQVRLEIQPQQLSLITADGTRAVERGQFQISVGGCQPGFESLIEGTTEVVSGIIQVTESTVLKEL